MGLGRAGLHCVALGEALMSLAYSSVICGVTVVPYANTALLWMLHAKVSSDSLLEQSRHKETEHLPLILHPQKGVGPPDRKIRKCEEKLGPDPTIGSVRLSRSKERKKGKKTNWISEVSIETETGACQWSLAGIFEYLGASWYIGSQPHSCSQPEAPLPRQSSLGP